MTEGDARMKEWREYLLGNVCEIFDGPHATPKKNKAGNIFLGISSLDYSGRITDSSFEFISDEDFTKWTRRIKPEEDDIVFSYETKLGVAARIPKDFTCCLGRRMGLLRVKNGFDPRFVLYAYLSPDFQNIIYERTYHGSTVDRIPLREMPSFPLLLPPLPEQKAIASVLSSLDDKIDLLHRQNKTLESMAETLFRQWFVEEADESWEKKSLAEVADFLNGIACQKYPPQDSTHRLPVLKIKELRNGISEDSDWASSLIDPNYIIKAGDVIFSWSASLVVKIWNRQKCVLNQHLFKVTSENYPKWFYYEWCKYHLSKFIAISSSHATTMGHIKRSDLDNAIVLIPTQIKLQELSSIINPILDKKIQNEQQISSIESFRDTLLPILMSGEVRVQYDDKKS